MNKQLIFIFIVTTIAFTCVQSEEIIQSNPRIQKNAEEYVRLHMVNKLSEAADMIKTPEGKKWLFEFRMWRRSILEDVILYYDHVTLKSNWFFNWDERLNIFQAFQTNYYKDLTVFSSWPKITFNAKLKHTILHFDFLKNYKFQDSIVTEEDIDHILRNHLPYYDHELKNLDNEKSERVQKTVTSNLKNEDLDSNAHGSAEQKRLRPFIRKYEVIQQSVIQDLLKTRYKLLRESLTGKKKSDLRYLDGIFQAERIAAQFDVWERFSKNTKNFDELPRHLQILKYDDAYRKYLNLQDTFFKGNIIYGYKDRHDNPENFNYDFELTAETIIGKRFKPMLELYNEIQDFRFTSRHYSLCELKDLPTIDIYLETFKSLTFNFKQSPFKKSQWFFFNTMSRLPVVRPKNIPKSKLFFKSVDYNKLYQDVDNKFLMAKNRPYDALTVTESILQKSLRYKNQMEKHFKLSDKSMRYEIVDKMISHFNSMNSANLLPHSALTSQPLQQSSPYYQSQSKQVISRRADKNKHDTDFKITINERIDELKLMFEEIYKERNLNKKSNLHRPEIIYTNSVLNTKDVNVNHLSYGSGDDSKIHNGHFSSNNNRFSIGSHKKNLHIKNRG